MRLESEIKTRINTIASKVFKGDSAKLQEISQKAELLSHLSEVNEADIYSDRHIKFGEKRAAVSSASKNIAQKLSFQMKPDPQMKNEFPNPPLAPVIGFKRKANSNRSLRSRNIDD